ncbi:hypothetical protein TNCV_1303121 [Trichonephila clavipes]|nr:hypothetical protein TNCV_1303121 [Trichonephila clavipes]
MPVWYPSDRDYCRDLRSNENPSRKWVDAHQILNDSIFSQRCNVEFEEWIAKLLRLGYNLSDFDIKVVSPKVKIEIKSLPEYRYTLGLHLAYFQPNNVTIWSGKAYCSSFIG